MRNAYKIVFGKLEGKRPLGIPRRRWKDNIKMYRETVRGYGIYSNGSGHGNEHCSIKGNEFLDQLVTINFSRMVMLF
jgi:hypothetical protein